MKENDAAKNNDNNEVEVVTGEVLDHTLAVDPVSSKSLSFGSFVTKSNDLIQKTKYSLPRTEQKILFMLLSKIDQKKDKDPSKTYTLTFSEFSKLTGVNAMDPGYINYLKDTVQSLERRDFWVVLPDGRYKSMSWLDRGTVVDTRDKTISIRFNRDLWPQVAQLTSNYTSYSIEYLLMMKSTYSMRVYEIILSYDNGSRNYGYNNGLVFEPVTEEILKKFPDMRSELKDYKYKRFKCDELRSLLSVPTPEERGRGKKKNSDEPAKYSREKTLDEKYPTYYDFDKHVLKPAKKEINEMTDLWVEYIPVRIKGTRKYEYLYFFIKYKSKDEMKKVRAFHDSNAGPDGEIAKKPRKTKRKNVGFTAGENVSTPLPDEILTMSYVMARHELESRIQYFSYEKKLVSDEKNILADILTYTSKLLTNQKKATQAEESLEALNRIIKNNGDLKLWVLGMEEKFKDMLQKATEKKSAQYYRVVVYNELIDNSAATVMAGQRKAEQLDGKSAMRVDMSVFDDE